MTDNSPESGMGMKPSGRRGQALIMAVLVMLVVLTTLIASLKLCETHSTISNFQQDKVQAYYYADSGIERVMAKISADPEWVETLKVYRKTMFYSDAHVRVYVEKQPVFEEVTLVVNSVGYYNQGKQSLQAVIKPGETPQVLSWKEAYPVLPH